MLLKTIFFQFNKAVSKVHPINARKWEVTVFDAKTKDESSYVYDAVMVCNGHYRDPKIPVISGEKRFKGGKRHSHDYRSPEAFAGKRVLLIGAGPSGTDISGQTASVASAVWQKVRK